MNSLPFETLHRVFRFLPPKTFYSIIPRLSRRIRSASQGAIPGCPGNAIGLACDLVIVTATQDRMGTKLERSSEEVWEQFLPLRRADGAIVWTVLSVQLRVSIGADSVDGLSRQVELALLNACRGESAMSAFAPDRLRDSIGVREVYCQNSAKKLAGKGLFLTPVLDFVRALQVPFFTIGDPETVDRLQELPLDFALHSVTKINFAFGIQQSSSTDDVKRERRRLLQQVFTRFPSVVALQGSWHELNPFDREGNEAGHWDSVSLEQREAM
ncbi:hypothetical protein HDU93_006471, partial [Gonapodya sp. JEL0774]